MATLSIVDGFEHGLATSGAAGVYAAIAGAPATGTSVVRTGSRSLEISHTAQEYVRYDLGSGNRVVSTAFYARWATLPGSEMDVLQFNVPGLGTATLSFDATDSKFQVRQGSGTRVKGGPVLTTGVWYRVVVEMDASAVTWVIRCTVDGGTGFQQTASVGAGDITQVFLGMVNNTPTATTYYDDWLISATDGDYEEMVAWVSHQVEGLLPTSDGTHNAGSGIFQRGTSITNISNSDTDVYTMVDNVPLDVAFTSPDFVRQGGAGTSNYIEVLMANLAAGSMLPAAVRGYASYKQSSGTGTTPDRIYFLQSDDTAVTPDMKLAADDPGVAVQVYKKMLSTSGGWTRDVVNGIKSRFGHGDGSPSGDFGSALVEVALYEAAAPPGGGGEQFFVVIAGI